MKRDFELSKYKDKWAVFDTSSRLFFFIGKGNKFCKEKVNELNSGI